MLVLYRTRGQKIRIGDDIEIVVTGVYEKPHRPSHAHLGISAPENVHIDRAEFIDGNSELNPKRNKTTIVTFKNKKVIENEA